MAYTDPVRNRSSGSLILLVIVLSAVSVFTRSHSKQSPDKTAVTVSEGSAPPEGQAVLPVYLSAAKGVDVGAISIRVGFPKALVAFVRLEPSGLAVGVDAKLDSDVKAGPSEALSMLHASLSTIHEGGSRQPLPVGPVAYLVFKIAKTAKPKTIIALTHEASAVTTENPPRPITPLVASKAEIIVSSAPVAACFFYMH